MTSRNRVILSISVIAIILVPYRSIGQPFDLETPLESPLWWTLTNEISPSELRDALTRETAHLDRYRVAVREGVAHPLNEEQVQALAFYYNRKIDPELTPLWMAFAAFATGHLEMMGEQHVVEVLADFGFDSPALALILEAGHTHHDRSQELAQELAGKSSHFVQILREEIQARGGDRKAYAAVKKSAKQGELVALLRSGGVSAERLSDLRTAWLRNPITEVAEDVLPHLRARLSTEDWERFREFLLAHVVPRMGIESKDFDYSKGVEK